MPPQDTYAKLLLSSAGRGYPLWTPQPSNELLMERPEGLAIGDVGIVLDDGGFDVFFNICLPPDHPFHLRHGVPQGFTCIHPGELDVRTIVDAEPLGHIISSSSIKRKTFGSSSDVSNIHNSNTLPYIFNLSSSEGALLVLPKGAERCDLLNEDIFLEQANRHGADWYNYAVNRRRRIISHDSLYLITGIHKTLAWSVAAFENATGNNHTAHFKQIEGNDHAPTYRWETTTCALDWRVGPRISYNIPNQSIFIRGFKIAIRSGFFGTRRISVEADVPSTRPKWTGVAPSNSSTLGRLAGFLGSSSGNNFLTTNLQSERTDAAEERLQSDHGGDDGTHVEIQRIPGVAPPFHPSDAINRYLLDKDPSANIAITHDNHWISLFEDGLLIQEFGHESFLETVLSQNYHTVSREGVVYLKKNLSQSTGRSTSEKKPATTTMPQSSRAHTMEEGVDLRDSDMGSVSLSVCGPFDRRSYTNQSSGHLSPPSSIWQSKAMSQRQYPEEERECFITLRDIIKDLSGDEPQSRQGTLRKVIEMLSLQLGTQKEAQCTPMGSVSLSVCGPFDRRSYTNQSPAHPPPSSSIWQSKAMLQKEYREKEQECFITLRDIIKDLSGDEPRTRQETLRKAIEMLSLQLGKQEEAQCFPRDWQHSADFDTATFYEGAPLHDQQYNMPDMDSAPNQPGSQHGWDYRFDW